MGTDKANLVFLLPREYLSTFSIYHDTGRGADLLRRAGVFSTTIMPYVT